MLSVGALRKRSATKHAQPGVQGVVEPPRLYEGPPVQIQRVSLPGGCRVLYGGLYQERRSGEDLHFQVFLPAADWGRVVYEALYGVGGVCTFKSAFQLVSWER